MDLVVPDDHTPVREVIRDVLARLLGRPRRGVHAPARHTGRDAASGGLQRLAHPGRRGPASTVPHVPATSQPPAPQRQADTGARGPLTVPPPPPGETQADRDRALAVAHGISYSTLSASQIWWCEVCGAAGFGAGTAADADHARHVATRQTPAGPR